MASTNRKGNRKYVLTYNIAGMDNAMIKLHPTENMYENKPFKPRTKKVKFVFIYKLQTEMLM
jgi:hypothetical protein